MNKVYIVYGTTGEYSDACEWNVKSFGQESTANYFCNELNTWLRENGLFAPTRTHRYEYSMKNPYDPQFRCDCTGTKYYVSECDFESGEMI